MLVAGMALGALYAESGASCPRFGLISPGTSDRLRGTTQSGGARAGTRRLPFSLVGGKISDLVDE